jgi:hypothetical protein
MVFHISSLALQIGRTTGLQLTIAAGVVAQGPSPSFPVWIFSVSCLTSVDLLVSQAVIDIQDVEHSKLAMGRGMGILSGGFGTGISGCEREIMWGGGGV